MGTPKLKTWLEITKIDDVKMLLEDGSFYKFMSVRPETWNVKDKVMIKEKSVRPDGPIGKNFNTVCSATNAKGGEPRSVTLDKSFNPLEQPSKEKRFNNLSDVEFGKKYIIEDVDSKSNITVGSKDFTLNPLSVTGKVDNIDWEKGDVVVFSKSVSRNEYNLNVENLTRSKGKNPKLGYFFPKD